MRANAATARGHRHRQLMDHRRRHVRAAAQPHQVVGDEAVEDAAEEPVQRPASSGSRRQKIVCVVTVAAGTIAAMSVIRLVDAATSR